LPWGVVAPATDAVRGVGVDMAQLRDLGMALSLQTGSAEDPLPDVTPER
jgi:hypothetical protein